MSDRILGVLSVILVAGAMLVHFHTDSITPAPNAVVEEAAQGQQDDGGQATLSPYSAMDAAASLTSQGSNRRPSSVSVANMPDDPFRRLDWVQACYPSSSCNLPSNDPRMADYLAGQIMADALREVSAALQSGPRFEAGASVAALDALAFPDGHVQAAAIDLLSTLPAQQQNVFPLLEVIEDNHDAKVVAAAMMELQRYRGLGYQQAFDEIFSAAMIKGSPYVSEKVAESLLPFLTEENVDHYLSFLPELPLQSRTRESLNVVLEEYALMHTGG